MISYQGVIMQKYGQLTVLSELGFNSHGKKLWRVLCDCGKESIKIASSVRNGKTRSCGCLAASGRSRATHGKRYTRAYTVWCNMKARCLKTNHPSYKNYGGRGISIAPQWLAFDVFLRDVGNPPDNDHTLDRIDNNKSYEPGNVRWVKRFVQSRNTRQNIWVTINGVTKCFYDWCEDYKIAAGSVYRRLAKGEDVVSAITRPKAPRFRSVVQSQ